MERTHLVAAEAIQTLQSKLAKAHRDIATLQAQHIAGKGLLERMANDIAEVLSVQEDMGCRLARLEESEQKVQETAEKTRHLMAAIPVPQLGSFVPTDVSDVRTLADEFHSVGQSWTSLGLTIQEVVCVSTSRALAHYILMHFQRTFSQLMETTIYEWDEVASTTMTTLVRSFYALGLSDAGSDPYVGNVEGKVATCHAGYLRNYT